MNLLMILLIILGIWVSAAICYFAWRMMPEVDAPSDSSVAQRPESGETKDTDTG